MDTLVETTKPVQDHSNSITNDTSNLTRKERRAKNLERESSKQIQKQSIRTRKSYVLFSQNHFTLNYKYKRFLYYRNDDMTLFNQLIDYPEFVKNPLDTLKKHLTSTS
jgi:hypothetical protein